MAKLLHSKTIVKILCKHFDFYFVSQKGSHIKLQKILGKHKITTIVPDHKEVAMGTLKGILKLAKIDEKQFWKKA